MITCICAKKNKLLFLLTIYWIMSCLYASMVLCLVKFLSWWGGGVSYPHTPVNAWVYIRYESISTCITCASSMSCHSLANWSGHSCRNPVHIDHQYWRKGAYAGVKQWPLWENHSLPSFHVRKGQNNEECLLGLFLKNLSTLYYLAIALFVYLPFFYVTCIYLPR